MYKTKPRTCSLLIILLALLSVSCNRQHRNALPRQYAGKAEIPGMSGIRGWGNAYSEEFQKDFVDSIVQYIKSKPPGYTYADDVLNTLALSGGGSNGAFAAGVLYGWGASGTRPTFKLVTGISTGSLIAPFAYLGGKYIKKIGRVYTSISTDEVMKRKSFLSILMGSSSIADSSPLADLIALHFDEDMLRAIAKAHSEGRRLFVGTTNLDARRLVIWNMGAIASSRHPKSLELFRKILLASASIPIVFPPVMIEVEAGGTMYDEMHVDGGVTTEVFFYDFIQDREKAHKTLGITKVPKSRLFIIRSNQLKVIYKQVTPSILAIAERTVSGLTTSQGLGDLYRIYLVTQRDGIDYNLARIPEDFTPNSSEPFDPQEMKRLYDLGYNMAKSGYPWEKYPPFFHK